MPFPVNVFTALRYYLIRRSSEMKTIVDRAAIAVPPRTTSPELAAQPA